MKTLVSSVALIPLLSAAVSGEPALENDRVAVHLDNRPGVLWSVTLPGTDVQQPVGPPVFEVDGRPLSGVFAGMGPAGP